MRNKYVYLILSVLVFIGCKEAAKYRDVILFTGTESSPIVRFVVEQPRSVGVSVTATDRVTKDTKVSIAIAKDLLEPYLIKSGRKYLLLPDNTYELTSTETVIKAGQTVSEAIQFTLNSFDGFEEGKTYCIPLSIVSTDGDFEILESSRTMYLVINRTVISKAVDLKESYAFHVKNFTTDPRTANVTALTMEIRVRMNGWSRDPTGISTLMGIEENFLFRFGDIIIKENQLQVAPAVIDGKKFLATGPTLYQTNKWHQVVCVYDGSALSIYVDGKRDINLTAGPGPVNFNLTYYGGPGNILGQFWFGQSCGARGLNGAISEARFWTRALSITEIQDNACYVSPQSEGLLGYWRFNELQEDGKTVRDETGNGFDAVCNRGGISFIDSVKCPN